MRFGVAILLSAGCANSGILVGDDAAASTARSP
jgi:hypothetical protein